MGSPDVFHSRSRPAASSGFTFRIGPSRRHRSHKPPPESIGLTRTYSPQRHRPPVALGGLRQLAEPHTVAVVSGSSTVAPADLVPRQFDPLAGHSSGGNVPPFHACEISSGVQIQAA